MKKEEFDVFVIGSGVAGKTVAESCADEGLKVAIAESGEYGGTCANKGCDPKKVLLGPTETVHLAGSLKGKGIKTIPEVDWKKLQKFKRRFTSHIPKATKKDFEEKGIKMYSDSPKFTGPNTLHVGDNDIKAKKIVIATGLVPRPFKIKGDKHFKHSEDFLSLKRLPKKIIFVGAGYIGMEFAQMAARAGSQVTIIENGDRPLTPFDTDLVAHLTETSRRLGMDFIFNAEIQTLRKRRKNYKLEYSVGIKKKTLKAKLVFNVTGRVPSVEHLDLKTGNVSYGEHGVKVDNHLRNTTNKDVYACGDVSNNSVPLSPLAGFEAHTVAKNILKGNRFEVDVPIVPSVVFTIPNLASVGYTEEEAKMRYKNVLVKYESVPDWYNNKRINGMAYAYKIIVNKRTKLIVGAHLLSSQAAETINLFAMAMNRKIKIDELKKMLFTYPSWSNDIKSMLP